MKTDEYHESVMVREVIKNLHIKNQAKYIDATLGTGGHTIEIAENGGVVLGIEADPKMLELAKVRLKDSRPTPKLVQGNFIDIDKIAKKEGFDKVSGILFDLGVTNLHLTSDSRGFSFGDPDSDLDMRLNLDTQGVKASDLINALREDQLVDLFSQTMDAGSTRWLVNRIIQMRPVSTVGDFLNICSGLRGKPGLNSATLPFLALRIAVNNELDNLEEVLPKAYELLEVGGNLIVISFHSGEDRIVKKFGDSVLIYPKDDEISGNPRARSAKMRVIKKI